MAGPRALDTSREEQRKIRTEGTWDTGERNMTHRSTHLLPRSREDAVQGLGIPENET